MTILGLDTSGDNLHLGLLQNETVVAATIEAHRRHAELLPQVIIDFLTQHGSSLDAITGYGLISGPGSFTGLRVGAATIMGLASAGNIPVALIPTLDLWHAMHGSRNEFLGCLIHCRSDLYYWSVFNSEKRSFDPLVVLPVSDIVSRKQLPPKIAVSDDPKTADVLHTFPANVAIVTGSGDGSGETLVTLAAEKIKKGEAIDWQQWQLEYGPTPGFRKWNKPT